jgi:hypothetical protein
MAFSLYEVTVPVFIRNLKVLQKLLEKGEAHVAGKDATTLTDGRLVADMKPLTFQVQVACDTAKFYAIRVGGVENVAMADTETTFAELQKRISATIAILESAKPESFEGKEDQEIREVKRKGVPVKLKGTQYTFEYSIPNFFFHVSMAYAILRKEGVDVGKNDYLGADL